MKSNCKIAVLMYHKLVDGNSGNIYERSVQNFKNDLYHFIDNDIPILPLNSLPLIKNGNQTLEKNSIIITFDDGNKSDFLLAYPILSENEIPASFFPVSSWIGKTGYLNSEDINLMNQKKDSFGNSFFSFECHSLSHPFLLKAREEMTRKYEYEQFLNTEIGKSRQAIFQITKKEANWFSLPYGEGAQDELIIKIAKKNGYTGIRTSIWNVCDLINFDLFCIPSLPILSNTKIDELLKRYF
jgi:peptidoglycan/xylan/chitin deacetylase (PgdA/CDA1 family)